MQWYYYSSPIPGSTDTIIQPVSSGLYSLVVVNEYGCTAISSDVLVVICDTNYQPTLDNNASTVWMVDSALYSNLQWYDSNGVIPGANHSFYPASSNGLYYIVATDEFGCSYSSDSVLLTPMHLQDISSIKIIKVGPNPVSNGSSLTIDIENIEPSEVTMVLLDFSGREVIRKVVSSNLFPYQFNTQEVRSLKNGLYYLDISFNGERFGKKIIKAGAN